MITPAEANPNRNAAPAPSPQGFKDVPAIEEPIKLVVEGHIPSWVNGAMYRTGAGKYNILMSNGDTHHVGHYFDGLAMLHRFEISGETQTVVYNSRHTSRGVEKRMERKDPTLVTFAPDPCKTIFGRMQSVYHHVSQFNTNAALQELDAEFDLINAAITPNFPLGKRLEEETGIQPGEALVVTRDGNPLQLVDTKTLKPLKMFNYNHVSDKLQGQFCASHRQYDEETDEYFNILVRLGPFPTFQTYSIGSYLPSAPGKEKVSCAEPVLHQPIWRHLGAWKTLEALKPSYVHSFSMTKNYIIVPNYPYYYSFGGLSFLYYSAAYPTFYWDESRRTLFHVIDRQTGHHVATYEAETCFAFHSANAWEEEIELPQGRRERVIYMDYCMYENPDIVDASFALGKTSHGKVDLDQVKPIPFVNNKNNQVAPSQLRRYRLGQVPVSPPHAPRWKASWSDSLDFTQWTQKRRVATYTILGHDVEMPRFNPRYNLKKYRYCWGVCVSRHAPPVALGSVTNGLIKLDLDKPYLGENTNHDSSAKMWDEAGCSCAEPIFIPAPEGIEEDEGVILSIVNVALENQKDSCFLLILDAATMKEIARTTIGYFHTVALHGSFVDTNGRAISVN